MKPGALPELPGTWTGIGSGFAAQNDRRVHFGLGKGAKVEKVEVSDSKEATKEPFYIRREDGGKN